MVIVIVFSSRDGRDASIMARTGQADPELSHWVTMLRTAQL